MRGGVQRCLLLRVVRLLLLECCELLLQACCLCFCCLCLQLRCPEAFFSSPVVAGAAAVPKGPQGLLLQCHLLPELCGLLLCSQLLLLCL